MQQAAIHLRKPKIKANGKGVGKAKRQGKSGGGDRVSLQNN